MQCRIILQMTSEKPFRNIALDIGPYLSNHHEISSELTYTWMSCQEIGRGAANNTATYDVRSKLLALPESLGGERSLPIITMLRLTESSILSRSFLRSARSVNIFFDHCFVQRGKDRCKRSKLCNCAAYDEEG